MSEHPHTNSNFLVDLGYGDPRSASAGFCEVIFPEFRIDSHERTEPLQPSPALDHRYVGTSSSYLILRRGATGLRDLYGWWDKARRGKAPQQRTVKISLLAEDHSSVVLTWYFRRARPVSLSYSPLNALQGSVLIESIELEFEMMEMR